MGELTIRINKRVIERLFWIVLIIVLGTFLAIKWNATIPVESDVDVEEMQTTIDTLTAKVSSLETDLEEAENDLRLYEEADDERSDAIGSSDPDPTPTPVVVPDPEPEEEELSGEVDISWVTRMDRLDPDRLDYVSVSIANGLERTIDLTYLVYWEDFYETTVKIEDDVVLKSGNDFSEIIIRDGGALIGSLTVNPPGAVDTLIFEVRDDDGDLVDKIESVLR